MKKKIVSIVLAILVLFSFSGCIFGKAGPKLGYGDFVYCYVDDAKSSHREFKEEATGVNILELTEEGQKKETIIIPENIDGLPVIAIGMSGLGWGYSIKGGDFDNVYLPATVQSYVPYNVFWHKTIFLIDRQDEKLMENRKLLFENCLSDIGHSTFFVFESMYSWYEEFISIDETCSLSIANLTYIVDKNEYWMGNYEEGEYVVFPQAPTKDGFVFDGWYKEQECINEWQEATDTYSKSEEVKTVNLYAKWIESE